MFNHGIQRLGEYMIYHTLSNAYNVVKSAPLSEKSFIESKEDFQFIRAKLNRYEYNIDRLTGLFGFNGVYLRNRFLYYARRIEKEQQQEKRKQNKAKKYNLTDTD